MRKPLEKLMEISSQPIGGELSWDAVHSSLMGGNLAPSIGAVLVIKNGFYAFESALHVFHLGKSDLDMDLLEWNSSDGWRSRYSACLNEITFFAEDVFGVQFCFCKDKIYSFDPETADLTYISDSIEGWINVVLTDYEFMTGYPLAHQWQLNNGPIPAGHRLIPKIPFVAGGGYDLSNLHLVNSFDAMLMRSELANQIKDLPDGSKIRINLK